MRTLVVCLFVFAPLLLAADARAASCSAFGVLKAYDATASTVDVEFTKMKATKFFVRPDGASGDITKIPKKCKRTVTKNTTFPVKATGGRLTVTQLRNNLSGKMMNDTESETWFKTEMDKLIASGSDVALVMRPGKKKTDPIPLTTIYLPASAEDLKEIERLEAQAQDVD